VSSDEALLEVTPKHYNPVTLCEMFKGHQAIYPKDMFLLSYDIKFSREREPADVISVIATVLSYAAFKARAATQPTLVERKLCVSNRATVPVYAG
jgi:hypothetical protein